MKLPVFTLLFFAFSMQLSGQTSEATIEPTEKKPSLIILTGLGMQWFENNLKFTTLSVERPMNAHFHIGLQGQYFFPKSTDYYGYFEFLKGYDISVYTKYFFHGRFSGRKTGLYIGPDIRYSLEKNRYYSNVFFPATNPEYTYYDRTSMKFLLRWGVQRHIGPAVLEITCPLGLQVMLNEPGFNSTNQFIMTPMFQLGYSF